MRPVIAAGGLAQFSNIPVSPHISLATCKPKHRYNDKRMDVAGGSQLIDAPDQAMLPRDGRCTGVPCACADIAEHGDSSYLAAHTVHCNRSRLHVFVFLLVAGVSR